MPTEPDHLFGGSRIEKLPFLVDAMDDKVVYLRDDFARIKNVANNIHTKI